jgi:hypothetical protein
VFGLGCVAKLDRLSRELEKNTACLPLQQEDGNAFPACKADVPSLWHAQQTISRCGLRRPLRSL